EWQAKPTDQVTFAKHDIGDLLGLPRLLAMGQCNGADGVVRVAVALANAFHRSVNDLSLTLVVSWFEQKGVVGLLTLLHLGVFKVLQDRFDLHLIGDSARAELRRALPMRNGPLRRWPGDRLGVGKRE